MADTDAASRPWIEGRRPGEWFSEELIGLALVSFASLNSTFERVERTDGAGQFPRCPGVARIRRSPASDWCGAARASAAHLDFFYTYSEPAAGVQRHPDGI